jgi:hypothetical protein
MEICSYGCGKEAKFFFKTGKGCCEVSPNSCEGKRNRDSEKKKGNFKGTPAWAMPDYKTTLPIVPWNKGKVGIYSDEYRKKISDSLKGVATGKASTPIKEAERKQKISETMKANPKAGGLRSRSGRGKKGWYKGYWCDSSWELAWVIYQLEHGFKFDRNWNGFKYFYENETHLYYPDYIIENHYYEIKGRRSYEDLNEKNKQKINQFEGNLSVLYSKDMKPYLDYVMQKYGNDFIKLYE